MNFVAFNSIYRYITTYSSSLSQVPQTRLSSQDSVEDPEAERPVSALPGHHSAVFELSRAWPHPRSNYTFLCFFSILPLMEINTDFHIHVDCGEKTGKPALLVRLYCYNAGRAKC